MRGFLLAVTLLLAVSPAAADVLILKDGKKVSGSVRKTKEGYSVHVEGQELVYDDEEVARHCKTPWDLIGDRAKLFDEAKAIFLEAMKIQDLTAQGRRMEAALDKITGAREACAEARDFFPEDKWSDLDKTLVNIMQLMRMIRERIGSRLVSAPPPIEVRKPDPEAGARPAPKPEPRREPPAAPPPRPRLRPEPRPEPPRPLPQKIRTSLVEAFNILRDKNLRSVPQGRRVARGLFQLAVEEKGEGHDLSMAGFLFFSGEAPPSEAAGGALDRYLAKHDPAKFEDLTPSRHIEAARFLADEIGKIRAQQAEAPADPLPLFAAAHLSAALTRGVPDSEMPSLQQCAESLNYRKSEYTDVWGTPEGLAAHDLSVWTELGTYDLATVQFRKDHLRLQDFGAHYAYAWLAMVDVSIKKDNYEKAYEAWLKLSKGLWTSDQKAHAKEVAQTIREKFPCRACGGTNHIRCKGCRGKKKVNLQCKGCGGSGKIQNPYRGVVNCRSCQGKGRWYNVPCPLCKETGLVKCRARKCRPMKLPDVNDFVTAKGCQTCLGNGTLFRSVALQCPECFGLGWKLIPVSDPSKVLK